MSLAIAFPDIQRIALMMNEKWPEKRAAIAVLAVKGYGSRLGAVVLVNCTGSRRL